MTRLARWAALFAAALATPAVAAAQAPSTVVFERIDDRFMVAPDVRVTTFDGGVGTLAGLYGGQLFDDALLVGGAFYWLADGPDASSLRYGGLLVGWSAPLTGRIRFGARGLAGAGTSTLDAGVPIVATRASTRPFARFGGGHGDPAARTFRARADFLVVEPSLTLGVRVAEHVAVDAAVGYRKVGRAGRLGSRIDGTTGGIALQLDW